MKYSPLGHTDLVISRLGLGTMTWGEQNTATEAHAQLDYAVAQGINFIDAAEIYPVPPRAETFGRTEAILGQWLAGRHDRDRLIIASKVCGQADWLPHVRGGAARLDRANISLALDESLRRLRTDYLDLYQLHWPDRRTNFFGQLGYTPADDGRAMALAETLAVLADLRNTGKIRHFGVSNETPWGVMRYIALAEQVGLPRLVSIQNPYNLLNRSYEIGLAEISHRERVGLLAYSPLGFGTLSGKYLDDARPDGARCTLFERFVRYFTPEGKSAAAAYVALARAHGLDPAQMALAYVNTRPFLTSTIIGATTMAQLRSNLASIDLDLSAEIIAGIETIHRQQPNPCP